MSTTRLPAVIGRFSSAVTIAGVLVLAGGAPAAHPAPAPSVPGEPVPATTTIAPEVGSPAGPTITTSTSIPAVPVPVPAPEPVPSVPPAARAATDGEDGVGRVVIADGHIDLGPRVQDGALRVQIRDDEAGRDVWRDLGDVVVWAVPESELAVPDDPAYRFLGPPGAPSWVLPQTQVPGIVWPGWNTQAPSVKEQIPGAVEWRLLGVAGPGSFHLFVTGNFGEPTVLFDSTRPVPQSLPIPHNTHAHGSWAFSRPGVYRLDVELRATTSTGTPVSDRRTLSVAVGAVDPTTAFPVVEGPPAGGGPTTGTDGATGLAGPAGGTGAGGSGGSATAGTAGSGASGGAVTTGRPTDGAKGATGDPLPSTGPGRTAALAAAGVALVGAGAALVRTAARRRPPPDPA